MLPRVDLDHLSPADLKRLVVTLMERIAGLEHTVAALREELARLKGLKGPPSIKPSGMEQASGDAPPKEGRRKRRRRGRGAANLSVHEDRVVKVAVPAGSRFKGYEDFLVQDVIVRAHVIRYRRERWLTPDGQTVIAPLPAGIAGHCGADLRRYVLALYHQGQLTVPRLVEHLASLGLRVSKRQIVRLLTDQAPFIGEARAVLRAGLRTARWISVDDTGARHKAERRVHADRRRPLHGVRDHVLEEPAELPRCAAGRIPGLRDQCRGAGLPALACPAAARHHALGRAPLQAVRR
jgi:hypothetical protein